MDQKRLLQQLQDGSISQHKRFQQLKTNQEKQRYAAKISQGNKNTMRTFSLRLFVLWFQNKSLYEQLKHSKELIKQFEDCMLRYNASIGSKEKEEKSMKAIVALLKEYKKAKKDLQEIKAISLSDKSYIMHAQLVLTLSILLFSNTERITYDKDIFNEKNRYSPLNPFFPI
jgi:hypothetical protein